jgi:transposase InsO family protein
MESLSVAGEQKREKHHSTKGKRYSFKNKLRAVKLHLEEGFPVGIISRESGISAHTLYTWVQAYRTSGEAGLEPAVRSGHRRKLPAGVYQRIVALKRKRPWWGVRRISQLLRRWFLLRVSPETVRRTLREEGLRLDQTGRGRRNLSKPRFFERAKPNQLWQSDIFTFRLGGKNAYLIGYIDDYSRYVVGLELYLSQTAENVLEVYRRAAVEYKAPQEMLTDRGRQYTSWRGSTRFEAEMQKDGVHHIKSRPHHPMTLGKIERFWKTIFQEFLGRAQFGSYEEARERIRLWLKYYNHKRPHQGIGGLCPADRYFEVAHELRQTLEQGMQENLLELALRGEPSKPFYLVGRMDGQSVVLRAEKGKFKLSVLEGEAEEQVQEVVYDLGNKDDIKGMPMREGVREGVCNDRGNSAGTAGGAADGGGFTGAEGGDNGHGRSGIAGSIAEDILRMGRPGFDGDAAGAGEPAGGPSGDAGGPGEGSVAGENLPIGEGTGHGQAEPVRTGGSTAL